MTAEREKQLNAPRMPVSAYEQLVHLQDIEYRRKVCEGLATQLRVILESNGIKIEAASSRPKTKEKIDKKILKRHSSAPLRDIYGVRFIIRDKDRMKIARFIQAEFPKTPERFEDGSPTIRDYADPEMRNFVRSKYNPNISNEYSAMHVNIVFLQEGSFVYDIAEVQIMTSEELKIYHKTRNGYENGKH